MYSSQINPKYDDVSPIQKQQAPMLIWKKITVCRSCIYMYIDA